MHSFILSNFSQNAALARICETAEIELTFENFKQHPDIYHIYPEINEKTILKKASLKIEQIRQLKNEFNKQPLMLPKQIAIIWQAQFLTLSAANALLKLLEEPVANSLIFLTTENYHQLLPTILSRCELVIAPLDLQAENCKLQAIDLRSLYQANTGDRMEMIALACPTQAEALVWLRSLMETAKTKLADSSPKGMRSLARLIENTQTIYNDIAIYNVNWKLSLDMLAIHWDKQISDKL